MLSPPFSLFIYIIYAFYLISNGFSKLISILKDKFRKNSVIPSEKDPSEKDPSEISKLNFFLFQLVSNWTDDTEFCGLIILNVL